MRRNPWTTTLALALLASVVFAGDKQGSPRRKDQEALKAYGGLVGSWRGTGQPRRGQASGAWKESAGWAWKLAEGSAALAVEFEKGKYLQSARLKPGKGEGAYVLEATLADGSTRSFLGQGDGEKPLVLTSDGAGDGVRRVTLTIPNDLRFLVLLESKPGPGGFARLGEVGFTRNGVAFAAGESGPACIVTGGRGTIQVSHKGQSYYVCCSGCKELFNQNPEAILAEAAAKAKAGEKK